MLYKKLINAGFSEKEALVYLAVLELGESNIAQISKKSGIKRATVYLEIDNLIKKGIISLTRRRKKKLYIAENPKIIEERLIEKTNSFSKIMPELFSIANAMEHKPKVRYFEGIEGLKEIYKDTLNTPGQEILGWYSDDRVYQFDKEFIINYYMKKRIEKKIYMRAFTTNSEFMNNIQKHDVEHLRKMKLINSEQFSFSAEINLYGKDKIAIVAHRENMGLIIESKKIFDTMKNIFEIMWLYIP